VPDGQTDRRTDRRTDGQNYDSQDRASIDASRGKNVRLRMQFHYPTVTYTCNTNIDNDYFSTDFVALRVESKRSPSEIMGDANVQRAIVRVDSRGLMSRGVNVLHPAFQSAYRLPSCATDSASADHCTCL